MTLDELRLRIDHVDNQILALLEERAQVACAIADVKRANDAPHFHDPERERRVIERLFAKGAGRFPRDSIRAVFREVMSACLSIEEGLRVSFLGPEGTFTHMAALKLFGLAARYREATTIAGVFDAVRSADVAYGVVPIENSTEGSVSSTADALLEGELQIRQELVIDISHCLLSTAPSLTAIERVYSHPQALGQCRAWLARNLPSAQLVQSSSTAAAAREALIDDRGAAIGSELASELYALPVLRDKVHDQSDNATRFVVLAKSDAPRTGDDKTTLAFALRDDHDKGALRRVLSLLEDAGVSLTRIESRPGRRTAWQYVFLADVAGHRTDDPLTHALDQMQSACAMVKLLGSYPRYVPLHVPG